MLLLLLELSFLGRFLLLPVDAGEASIFFVVAIIVNECGWKRDMTNGHVTQNQ